ncbi:MAG: hypothetical protein QM655_04940 [Nocardioidaceae bacterium]
MIKKLLSSLLAVGFAASSLVFAQAVTQSASAAGSCPNNNWTNLDDNRVNNNFANNGVNIRTGDSVDCTSLGQGQKTHDTRLHCWTFNGTWGWNHLRDINTTVVGWVRDDQLNVVAVNYC